MFQGIKPDPPYPLHGEVWYLANTSLTVVLAENRSDRHSRCWKAVVIDAPEGSAYPVGGYDIIVFHSHLKEFGMKLDVSQLDKTN